MKVCELIKIEKIFLARKNGMMISVLHTSAITVVRGQKVISKSDLRIYIKNLVDAKYLVLTSSVVKYVKS